MPVVVIVGPEKAGKTTLCEELQRIAKLFGIHDVDYQHRTGKEPFTQADAHTIMHFERPDQLMIFDRAWPCAVIYGERGFKQLHSALGAQAESTVGRFIRRGRGETIVLLGPEPETLESKRTPDDLPIPPAVERAAYKAYGELHGWRIVEDYAHTPEQLQKLAMGILSRVLEVKN